MALLPRLLPHINLVLLTRCIDCKPGSILFLSSSDQVVMWYLMEGEKTKRKTTCAATTSAEARYVGPLVNLICRAAILNAYK